MSVSSTVSVPRRIGATEPLGANARRVACRAQGEVMEAGGGVGSVAEHLEIQELADRQGDPIRRQIWRLLVRAAETAKREAAYETHALLIEMRTLAHRYEAYERIEDERRAAMTELTGDARQHLRTGTALLDTLLTGGTRA